MNNTIYDLTAEDWKAIFDAIDWKARLLAAKVINHEPLQPGEQARIPAMQRLNGLIEKIGPQGEDMVKTTRKPHIIIEQSEGLISAVWANDPSITVQTFYGEDDPPEGDEEEHAEWEQVLKESRQTIADEGMVDILYG